MEHLPEILIVALIAVPAITLAIITALLYRAHRERERILAADPDDFWHHQCPTDRTTWAVARGSPCTWCGETEGFR